MSKVFFLDQQSGVLESVLRWLAFFSCAHIKAATTGFMNQDTAWSWNEKMVVKKHVRDDRLWLPPQLGLSVRVRLNSVARSLVGFGISIDPNWAINLGCRSLGRVILGSPCFSVKLPQGVP